MAPSSLTILARYQYDPLDRLMGVGLLERASTRRFYQENYLVTELDGQGQRSIVRHAAQPLAQRQSMAGVSETTLLVTDRAHSLLLTLTGAFLQHLSYTGYGHAPVESGLSRLLGFNGGCPDRITGHYLLGKGKRAFNPVLMRFNSPDELSPFEEGGLNAYAYCAGDPINYYDPTGNARFHVLIMGMNATRDSVIVRNPMYNVKKTTATTASLSAPQHINAPTGPSTQQPGPSNSSVIAQPINVPHPLPAATNKWITSRYPKNINNSNKKFTSKLKTNVDKYDQHIKDKTPNFTTIASDYQSTQWSALNTKLDSTHKQKKPLTHRKIIRQLEDLAARIKTDSVNIYETRNNIRQ